MPATLTGIIASVLLLLNTLFWSCLLFPLTFLKVIIPIAPVRRVLTALLAAVANAWISCNSGWMI
ncbi:MAG: acyltransferase, partial [Thalassolituus sp.]